MVTNKIPTLSMRQVVTLPLAQTFERLRFEHVQMRSPPRHIYLTHRRRIRCVWQQWKDDQGKPHGRYFDFNPLCLLAAFEQLHCVKLVNPFYPLASISCQEPDTLRMEFIREASGSLPGRKVALKPILRRRLWDIVSTCCAREDPLWYLNAWPWRYLGRVPDQVTDLAWELPEIAPAPCRIRLQLFHLPIIISRMTPGQMVETRCKTLDTFLYADAANRVIFWALGRIA